jgi:hypothetical protein
MHQSANKYHSLFQSRLKKVIKPNCIAVVVEHIAPNFAKSDDCCIYIPAVVAMMAVHNSAAAVVMMMMTKLKYTQHRLADLTMPNAERQH